MPTHGQSHHRGLLDLQTEPPQRILLCWDKARHFCIKPLLSAVRSWQGYPLVCGRREGLGHQQPCFSSPSHPPLGSSTSHANLSLLAREQWKLLLLHHCPKEQKNLHFWLHSTYRLPQGLSLSNSDLAATCTVTQTRPRSPASRQRWWSVVLCQQHPIRNQDVEPLGHSLHWSVQVQTFSIYLWKGSKLKAKGFFKITIFHLEEGLNPTVFGESRKKF